MFVWWASAAHWTSSENNELIIVSTNNLKHQLFTLWRCIIQFNVSFYSTFHSIQRFIHDQTSFFLYNIISNKHLPYHLIVILNSNKLQTNWYLCLLNLINNLIINLLNCSNNLADFSNFKNWRAKNRHLSTIISIMLIQLKGLINQD